MHILEMRCEGRSSSPLSVGDPAFKHQGLEMGKRKVVREIFRQTCCLNPLTQKGPGIFSPQADYLPLAETVAAQRYVLRLPTARQSPTCRGSAAQ